MRRLLPLLALIIFTSFGLASAAPSGGDTDLLTNGTFKAYSGGGAPGSAAPTWTKTTVTLTGSSQNLLSANLSRIGFMVVNRVGNAQIDVDPSGGVVAANTGIPLTASESRWWVGAATPTGAVTVIGTAAQVVNVWELQ